MRLRLLRSRSAEGKGTKNRIPESEGMKQAAQAEQRARGQVEQARSRSPEVRLVVNRLREFQQVNHVGERVIKALQDGYGRHEGEHGH